MPKSSANRAAITRAAFPLAALLIACVFLSAACREKPRFREPLKLGGQEVPAETLNEGYEAYMHYCYACHGEKGDGHGPSAPGMRPPPRDFTTGDFKFAGVMAGELPNDEDLVALVRNGLDGTPMLPWDMSDRERHATVQYIKTFSERWKNETPGEQVVPEGPDPWSGRQDEAITLGKKLYHLSGVEMDPATQQMKSVLAGCNTCHPSYLTRQELTALSQKVLTRDPDFREDMYRPALKESGYKAGDKNVGVLATDFLFHRIKNGTTPLALFRTIAAGIGGTAMPTWKGGVKDEDLWALAYYVKSLADMRDTPHGASLQKKLARQAP
jgi:mono/diheme cytochrome c family protein